MAPQPRPALAVGHGELEQRAIVVTEAVLPQAGSIAQVKDEPVRKIFAGEVDACTPLRREAVMPVRSALVPTYASKQASHTMGATEGAAAVLVVPNILGRARAQTILKLAPAAACSAAFLALPPSSAHFLAWLWMVPWLTRTISAISRLEFRACSLR